MTSQADDKQAAGKRPMSRRLLEWGTFRLGLAATGGVSSGARATFPPGTTITAIRAGCAYGLALTSDGKILAWGSNNRGQLGNGTTTDSSAPVRTRLPRGTKNSGLFAGCQHTLALTTTGKVLAWGANSAGQLGNGRTGGHAATPVRTRLPKGTTVAAISAGCDHSLARTRKGHVLAWGLGHNGELGNGTTTSSDIPVRVKLPAGLAATALGAGPDADFTIAIVR
jgi:alpha-tubulin suppressor-like RCC1 family protein